jgi:hypothetical protein
MKRLLWGLLILSIAGCGWTASLEEMKASSPPRDDKLIVPGWRVGQLYLGMTSVALFAAMGEPDTTKPRNNFTWFRWENRGLSVLHDMEADQVEAIEVHHESYKTAEGVHIGMSELAVVAILGTPQASYIVNRDRIRPLRPARHLWLVVIATRAALRHFSKTCLTTIQLPIWLGTSV